MAERAPAGLPPLVEVQGLRHVYRSGAGQVTALQDVDLELGPGERMALMGRSGSGKTTLLGILAGLEVPTSGRVVVAGHHLGRLDRRERETFRRRVVGYVWQDAERGLVPSLTVVQNVILPMLAEPASNRQRLAFALELLDALGLQDLAGAGGQELSAGETQRLALAVALANRPLLLLADELTASLDRPAAGRVMSDLVALLESTATAAILVTHDQRLQRYVDGAVTIRDGSTNPADEAAPAAVGAQRSGDAG
jgi:ABC-type lipoprotein export system ATPase subunit